MKFPYSSYEVEPTAAHADVSVVYRPVIPFRGIGKTDVAVFYGLLDTGADETVLPQAIADLIGVVVDPTQTSVATSASGELPIVYGKVTLEIGKGKGRYRWQATVGVVNQPWQEAILGHAGFLHYFNAVFSWSKREVRLTRNDIALPAG